MVETMRGIYTIPSTPLDDQGRLDEQGLRAVVDFCVACGAHGIVTPVNASEFTRLSDEERLRVAHIAIEQTAGRVPVVIGTAGLCAEHAVMFSCHADAHGADAVIAMPPYASKIRHAQGLVDYYRAISNAIRIPIFVQNYAGQVGTDMSVATLLRLVHEVERVEYIKEETLPATHKLSQISESAGPKLRGVFGGSGGRYLLLEHPRGSAGNMPGCHVTDVVVQLWNALESGDRERAKHIYGLLAPLFALEIQCPGALYKTVLQRRSVIRSAYARNAPRDTLDAQDQRALDEILDDLRPLFTWSAWTPACGTKAHCAAFQVRTDRWVTASPDAPGGPRHHGSEFGTRRTARQQNPASAPIYGTGRHHARAARRARHSVALGATGTTTLR